MGRSIKARSRAYRPTVSDNLEPRALLAVNPIAAQVITAFGNGLNFGRWEGGDYYTQFGGPTDADSGWARRPPLAPTQGAHLANQEWANRRNWLQQNGYFGRLFHVDPITEEGFDRRLKNFGETAAGGGENVGGMSLTTSVNTAPIGPIEGFVMWVRSPGHFANLNTIWDWEPARHLDRYGVGTNWFGPISNRSHGSFASFSMYGGDGIYPWPPFLKRAFTGTISFDRNGNGWFDVGEGRDSTVRATSLTNGEVVETTSVGGNFSLDLRPGHTYQVEARGGDLATPITGQVTMGEENRTGNFLVGRGMFLDFTEVITPTIPRTAPTATNDTASGDAGKVLQVNLLQNDSPGQGSTLLIIDAQTTTGTPVEFEGSNVKFVPPVGKTTIVYLVANEAGLLGAASLTVTGNSVPPGNNPPGNPPGDTPPTSPPTPPTNPPSTQPPAGVPDRTAPAVVSAELQVNRKGRARILVTFNEEVYGKLNGVLIRPGRDGVLGTADDRRERIRPNVLKAATGSRRRTFALAARPNRAIQLQLGNVTDLIGNALPTTVVLVSPQFVRVAF